MSAAALKYLTVNATTKHTATVIFVHGLGDTGYGWKPFADLCNRDPDLSHVKWILPHAPSQPVTVNLGAVMPAWFDIRADFESDEDEKGILETLQKLNKFISDEVESGNPANRIVIGGFSQGGAMSVLTGLTSNLKLGGAVVLSGWLPLSKKIKGTLSDNASSLPIFWGHGIDDPLVRIDFATRSVDFLKSNCGISEVDDKTLSGLKYNKYAGLGHSSSEKELSDLKAWLKSVIPRSNEDA